MKDECNAMLLSRCWAQQLIQVKKPHPVLGLAFYGKLLYNNRLDPRIRSGCQGDGKGLLLGAVLGRERVVGRRDIGVNGRVDILGRNVQLLKALCSVYDGRVSRE